MVALAAAVPFSVGVVSSVLCPEATGPSTGPALSVAGVKTGASGTDVSTVRLNGGEVTPVLPAASVALKVMVCGPSPSAVVGVKVQLPWALTTAVPISTSSTITCTVAPTSPVPLKVGRVSLVEPLLAMIPVPGLTSSITVVTTGAAGPVVSTVKANTGELAETFPTSSLAFTRRLYVPSVRTGSGVKVQLPLPSTVVVPISTPLFRT